MLAKTIEEVTANIRSLDTYVAGLNKSLALLEKQEARSQKKIKMLKKTNREIRKILTYLYDRLKDYKDGKYQ